jgi:hypothetical protein
MQARIFGKLQKLVYWCNRKGKFDKHEWRHKWHDFVVRWTRLRPETHNATCICCSMNRREREVSWTCLIEEHYVTYHRPNSDLNALTHYVFVVQLWLPLCCDCISTAIHCCVKLWLSSICLLQCLDCCRSYDYVYVVRSDIHLFFYELKWMAGKSNMYIRETLYNVASTYRQSEFTNYLYACCNVWIVAAVRCINNVASNSGYVLVATLQCLTCACCSMILMKCKVSWICVLKERSVQRHRHDANRNTLTIYVLVVMCVDCCSNSGYVVVAVTSQRLTCTCCSVSVMKCKVSWRCVVKEHCVQRHRRNANRNTLTIYVLVVMFVDC